MNEAKKGSGKWNEQLIDGRKLWNRKELSPLSELKMATRCPHK
jgi:hypothetical protein